ncbi:unnamed protein product [Coregonus sp. 'balchen']|nr:unnamed protein product [Coregonus sp. 'balchen']
MDRGGRGRGRGGRGRRGNRVEDKDVSLSKSLSFALRHGANQMGLHMNPDGFLFVEDLLAHAQFHSFSLEDVKRVVCDLDLKAVQPGSPDCPREGIHGSYLRLWPSIRSQGLSRMNRTHIHLALGLPGEDGVISEGIQFFWSENSVLLTPGDTEGKLHPRYFSRALKLRPTQSILQLE